MKACKKCRVDFIEPLGVGEAPGTPPPPPPPSPKRKINARFRKKNSNEHVHRKDILSIHSVCAFASMVWSWSVSEKAGKIWAQTGSGDESLGRISEGRRRVRNGF